MNPPAGTHEELISVPRSTFMSMLQTNLDTMKQSSIQKAPLHAPEVPFCHQTQPRFAPLSTYPPAAPPYFNPVYGPLDVPGSYTPYHPPPAAAFFNPWAQFPPDLLRYAGNGLSHSPASHPARPNKRKRDGEDDYEAPLFPGENQKDFHSLSKSIAAIQSELKDIRNSTMSQPKLVTQANIPQYPQPTPPQAAVHAEYVDPARFQAGQGGYFIRYVNPFTQDGVYAPGPPQVYQQPHQTIPQPIPTQAPPPTAAPLHQQPVQHDAEDKRPQQSESEKHPAPKEARASTASSQPAQVVEASSKPSQVSQLQKIFCDEILNKK
ncbi:capsid scaffold protein [Rhinolophus gammaherpesvirus 1]|nr:capsid scaffold protein [Rhinolophus gammaherpesvirus 1]BBB06466.1 capsid scaffold protein [Rhinolophus gammaherpesvirus 1]